MTGRNLYGSQLIVISLLAALAIPAGAAADALTDCRQNTTNNASARGCISNYLESLKSTISEFHDTQISNAGFNDNFPDETSKKGWIDTIKKTERLYFEYAALKCTPSGVFIVGGGSAVTDERQECLAKEYARRIQELKSSGE